MINPSHTHHALSVKMRSNGHKSKKKWEQLCSHAPNSMIISSAKPSRSKLITKHLSRFKKKSIDKTPARLQNMLLKLQKYSLEVIYKRGKDMHLADALSHGYISGHTYETYFNIYAKNARLLLRFEQKIVHIWTGLSLVIIT